MFAATTGLPGSTASARPSVSRAPRVITPRRLARREPEIRVGRRHAGGDGCGEMGFSRSGLRRLEQCVAEPKVGLGVAGILGQDRLELRPEGVAGNLSGGHQSDPGGQRPAILGSGRTAPGDGCARPDA